MSWVKFNSHRARQRAEQTLKALPEEWYSFNRNYHLFNFNAVDIEKIKHIKGVVVLNKLPPLIGIDAGNGTQINQPKTNHNDPTENK